MGDEITSCDFTSEDIREFKVRLRDETRVLMNWFQDNDFENSGTRCGFELEAWLVDGQFHPAPINENFLENVNSHLVVPELAKFNFEINSTPHPVAGALLSRLENELARVWETCERHAQELQSKVMAIGILPTVRDDVLHMDNMSPLNRYQALNRQVLKLRGGKPLNLKIDGRDSLRVEHNNVMLESAATSLQIHLQVNPADAVRHYNLSQILSAPMVAAAANSPYLFGKDLWDETRIPTFEQSVSVASFPDPSGRSIGRVTFGTGYCKNSVLEPFLENLDGFPVLLPLVYNEDSNWLNHLRLHNGTIWRWTRPLIGLSSDGKPHLRIEHRVPAAGPSLCDTIANVAFFVGMVQHFVARETPLEHDISFEDARENFYQAARLGLDAKIKWARNADPMPIRSVLTEVLLPAAEQGLQSAGLLQADIDHYIGEIMANRLRGGQNGATWQRAFIAANGNDFQKMTESYYEFQKQNLPVYRWEI